MNKLIRDVRKLIKTRRCDDVRDLYQVMSAIRGNDKHEEGDLKELTIAIRAFMGFDAKKHYIGFTVTNVEEVAKVINEVKTRSGHYSAHLHSALNVIGKEELLAFMRKQK